MTESTQILCNNISDNFGGTVIETHYIDMIEPKEQKDADPEEIKDRIISGLRKLGDE